MNEDVEHWLNLADYDFETSAAMLKSGRYLYVLFTCQQAIEKTLKAIIILKTDNLPPRIHDLLKLANLVGLELDPSKQEFLNKLSYYYLETRYPEQISDLSQSVDSETAAAYFSKSKEILNWLRTKIA